MLNNAFLIILTVQILDHFFVQRFEEHLNRTAPQLTTDGVCRRRFFSAIDRETTASSYLTGISR
jgi:hypothetical protein